MEKAGNKEDVYAPTDLQLKNKMVQPMATCVGDASHTAHGGHDCTCVFYVNTEQV